MRSRNNAGSTKEAVQPGTVTPLSLLTDGFVSGICIPLLPRCAYSKIKERTLLDQSLLQDKFLGQLVAAVLSNVVQRKLARYVPIPERQIQLLGLTYENDDNINNIHSTLVTWTRIAWRKIKPTWTIEFNSNASDWTVRI